MKALGYDINKVTQKEVQELLDSAEALTKQKTKAFTSQLMKDMDVPKKQPTTKSLLKGEKYTDERGRVWDFGTEDRPFPGANLKVVPKITVDEHITFIKSKEPIESMKEANKVIKREGRYKNVTPEESQKILKDTDDHIFQRDPKPDEFDPDYASGGRIGYAVGKIVKGGRWFIKNLESLIKEAQNPGPWSRFSKMEAKDKSLAIVSAKERIRSIKAGGPIPDEALESIVANPKFSQLKEGSYMRTDPEWREMEEVVLEYRKKHAYGGRIGYAGGGKTGLPAVTMGTPQMNMQQPQMPAGPQPAGIPGGTIVAQNQMQQSPWMGSQMPQPGGMPRPMAAEGGIMRMPFGLGSMSRRAFIKMMAGITGTGVAAGTGLLKLGKAAKVVPKVTETIAKGADGMPVYITDLIEVVKAKGTRDVIEGFKKSDYSTVHRYKGVEVIDDPSGAIRIKKPQEKQMYGSDEPAYHEVHIEITPGGYIQKGSTVSDDAAKAVKAPDEYFEATVKPDMDGKMKDVIEEIDEIDHLDLKEIADEIDTLVIKKASGGLAYALGE